MDLLQSPFGCGGHGQAANNTGTGDPHASSAPPAPSGKATMPHLLSRSSSMGQHQHQHAGQHLSQRPAGEAARGAPPPSSQSHHHHRTHSCSSASLQHELSSCHQHVCDGPHPQQQRAEAAGEQGASSPTTSSTTSCCSSDACWICLGDDDAERGPLFSPCRCPRMCHSSCLARWQLHCAGKDEEKLCRFCGEQLPDWKLHALPMAMAARQHPAAADHLHPAPADASAAPLPYMAPMPFAAPGTGAGTDYSLISHQQQLGAAGEHHQAAGYAPATGLAPPAAAPAGNGTTAAPPAPDLAPAYMRISYNGRSHKIRVRTGEAGRQEFIADCRRLLRIPPHLEFDVVFHCKEPQTQSDLRFRGLGAFDAAVFCASVASTTPPPPAATPPPPPPLPLVRAESEAGDLMMEDVQQQQTQMQMQQMQQVQQQAQAQQTPTHTMQRLAPSNRLLPPAASARVDGGGLGEDMMAVDAPARGGDATQQGVWTGLPGAGAARAPAPHAARAHPYANHASASALHAASRHQQYLALPPAGAHDYYDGGGGGGGGVYFSSSDEAGSMSDGEGEEREESPRAHGLRWPHIASYFSGNGSSSGAGGHAASTAAAAAAHQHTQTQQQHSAHQAQQYHPHHHQQQQQQPSLLDRMLRIFRS